VNLPRKHDSQRFNKKYSKLEGADKIHEIRKFASRVSSTAYELHHWC